jgi:hypothetical protein
MGLGVSYVLVVSRNKVWDTWFWACVVESAAAVPEYIMSGGYRQQFGWVMDWTRAEFHDGRVNFGRVGAKKTTFISIFYTLS